MNKQTVVEKDQLNIENNIGPLRKIARINACVLKIAFPYIPKDDNRPEFNGLNIRKLGDGKYDVMISATDGTRMVACKDHGGYAEEEIIVKVSIDAIRHANAGNTFNVMSNGSAMICNNHGDPVFIQPGNSLINAKFPDVKKIINPDGYAEGFSGRLNINYLRDAISAVEKCRFASVRLWTKDEKSPFIFSYKTNIGLDVVHVIMAMRDDGNGFPLWITSRDNAGLNN